MFTYKDYIYAVYVEKSFTAAAKKLYISQPALSFAVKKTEEKIGAVIFDRRQTPVCPTEAGMAYIEAVEKINAIEEGLTNKLGDIAELKTGTLTIGGANSAFSCVLPDIIRRFRDKYPGITLKFVESSSEELKNMTLNGKIDAVIDYDFSEKNFDSLPIKKEKIYLVAEKDSDFARQNADRVITIGDFRSGNTDKAPINLSLVEEQPIILLKQDNDMCRRGEDMLAEAGIDSVTPVMRLDQLMTAYRMACRGLGLSFVTDTMIMSEQRDAAYFALNSPYSQRILSIAYKKGLSVPKRLSVFVKTAAQTYTN